uniref:Uncharacterized protein n=1 Tax=Triticum urartu TaxID=4572 RepID=A0A8R7PXY8_TRIUA
MIHIYPSTPLPLRRSIFCTQVSSNISWSVHKPKLKTRIKLYLVGSLPSGWGQSLICLEHYWTKIYVPPSNRFLVQIYVHTFGCIAG